MTEHDTTVLSNRLHRLADDVTPRLDVVGLVRDARARNARKRRGRIAFVAVATATAAVVGGSVVAADVLSADSGEGDTARPSAPTSSAPSPTPVAPVAPVAPTQGTSTMPAGWEPRHFQGVTFAVPPGARMADYVYEGAEPGLHPEFIWNGPALGGDAYAVIKVQVLETVMGGLPPTDGVDPVTVPGADQAYMWLEQGTPGDLAGNTVPVTNFGIEILDGDRRIHLHADLAGGAVGEQMARDLLASLTLTQLPDGQHFAYVTAARAVPGSAAGEVGELTVRPAEWLGSSIDDLSCLDGQDAPLNVSDHCVGPAGTAQTLGAADGPYELHPGGDPFRTVGFAEFSAVVASEAAVPQGPVMGWLTIRDGLVVGFEQVTEQVA